MLALVGRMGVARAEIAVPGADGSDGEFSPGANVTIDLGQAKTAPWNSPSSGGLGVYDPNKWAVVFKYTSVNIPSGVSVAYNNNSSRAPVVWLVSGDVMINGALILNGANGAANPFFAEPGPGGFRGGNATVNFSQVGTAGFGPGGGLLVFRPWDDPYNRAMNGSYGTKGTSASGNQGGIYGNAQIVPLIGGSGGAGTHDDGNRGGEGGGGGGGAILIVARGTISVNGGIYADGGTGAGWAAGGSGGAIRLVSDRLLGGGRLEASGGGTCCNQYLNGGLGRIRLEANVYDGSHSLMPRTIVTKPNNPILIWPPSSAPTIRILSVGGTPLGTDPTGRFSVAGADITIPSAGPAEIVAESRNLPPNSTVVLRMTRAQNQAIIVSMTPVDGATADLAQWKATVEVPTDFAALQVRAVSP